MSEKSFFKKIPTKKELMDIELLSSLYDAADAMRMARMRFENLTDPDLIDSCIYEINAAQARYSYLFAKAREENLIQPHVFKMSG